MRLSRRRSVLAMAGAAGFAPKPVEASEKSRRNGAEPIRLVVLDVGGTLIEERGDVPETLRLAFADHGITVSASEIAPWRGASKREVVRHFVEQKGVRDGGEQGKLAADIYQDFRTRLDRVYQNVPPVGGAEEALRKLRERGYLLATSTGFDRETTIGIFHRLGWEGYFAAVVSSDDVALGRPAPYMIFHAMEAARVSRVAAVAAVGDTPLDLQAGSNAGLGMVVGVLSGAATAEQLRHEPHTNILPSVAGLPALLERG